MTSLDVDPFAEDPIGRDSYGRPKIIPIKRGKPDPKGKLVPYTRVSTFAGALDETGGLLKWSLWHLALGLGRNPDLAALAGVFGPTVDDLSRYDKGALDQIIERAHDRSGGNVKADYGTVVHAYTEPGAQAVPDPFGPGEGAPIEQAHRDILASLRADVAAYSKIMDDYGLEVLDTEQFVVNDEIQSAGTYDHKVRLTRDITFGEGDKAVTVPAGTIAVLDKKTGKLHFDSQAIQLAVYANAKTYDPLTGERDHLGASFDHAILAHIPKSGGEAFLYLVDIRAGWAAAKLAEKVRAHRTRKDLAVPFPAVVVDSGNAEIPPPAEPADSPTMSGRPLVVTDAPAVSAGPIVGDFTSTIDLAGDVWSESPISAPPADEPDRIAEPETVEDAVANLAAAGLNPVGLVDTILAGISLAPDGETCRALWSMHKATWTDQHTAAVKARLAELAAA